MKIASIIAVLLLVGLVIGNAVEMGTDLMSMVGLVILLVIVTAVWGGALFLIDWAPLHVITILFVAWAILGSGGQVISKIAGTPDPLIEVDNSVNVYPAPDPTAQPEAWEAWKKEKIVIEPGEGATKVFVRTWVASIASFWIFYFLAWLFAQIPIPAIRGIQIPLEIVFLLISIWVASHLLVTPLNTGQIGQIDQAANNALKIQFTLGFSQGIWWAAVISGIGLLIKGIRRGAAMIGIYAVGIAASSVTWLAIGIWQTAIDPTTIAWTLCSNQVYYTSLSNALCQEAFVSGKVAALALSLAWGWLTSLFAGGE